MDDLHELVSQTLSHPYDEEEVAALRLLSHVVAWEGRATERDCPDGHVTASVLLVDVDTMTTFLVDHPKMGRWMQLGGHVEVCDTSIRMTAMREAVEESGLFLTCELEFLGIGAFDNVPCPAGSLNTHFDVRFLATVSGDRAVLASHTAEHLDSGWFPLADLPEPHDADLALLAAQALLVLCPAR